MILNSTRIFKVRPDLSGCDDMAALRFAADVLKNGGLVAFPTETVYGLGANALDENVVEKIFEAKGRPNDNPLIVHLSSYEDMHKYCDIQNEYLPKLYCFMPGPLTVVLPKKDIIPKSVSGGLDTVGIRVPQSLIARKLIELSGVPVAAPSANVSGKPSPTCAEHVINDLSGKVDVIIDGGSTGVGVESTVITLCTQVPLILRPGGVSHEALKVVLGKVDLSPSITAPLKDGETAFAPGMKYRHYAPETPVYLIKGEEKNVLGFLRTKASNEKCAVLCYYEDLPFVCGKSVYSVGGKNSPEIYARVLFACLRKTDSLSDINAIYARIPESTDGISLAVYNRLLKASGFSMINSDEYKNRIKIIGLTGPTGAGKSLFCLAAKKRGINCIDTDKIGHEILQKDTPAYRELSETFGRKILDKDKTISRKKLGEIVFSSPEMLAELNRITHKYISLRVCEIINEYEKAGCKAVCIDAPVLFESDIPRICDCTVGVIADEKIRCDRIIKRDNITVKKAAARMSAAKDTEFFKEKCDFILENNQSEQEFLACADILLQKIESMLKW